MRRILRLTCVAGVVALLAGCSSGASSSDQFIPGSAESSRGDAPLQLGTNEAGDSSVSEGAMPMDADAVTDPAADTRSVITNGYLSMTVDEPLDAADEVVRIVEGSGGRVDERSEQPVVDGRDSSAQLIVRIPSSDLTATLDLIEALGEVQQSSLSNSDVTSTVQDLDARISALTTSVDRLVELLGTATSTEDLIAIESALSQRQADLESLESQRRSIGDQVDLATVSIDIGSESTALPQSPDDFGSGFSAGWEALVAFASGALVVAGVVLPWLLVVALITALIAVTIRARRRRRLESDPSATGDSAAANDTSGG